MQAALDIGLYRPRY